jgi:hypothetical protein
MKYTRQHSLGLRIRTFLMRIRAIFNADPDQSFHFNEEPDPTFHFNADPDPAPDANLQPLVHSLQSSIF